ncbi:RNA polymerase II transcription factor B subunit 3 [Ceratocystis fimbriata CBS 114723]|uniref:RNA polymerase II transcription factor B subunit 3 n=1 Tax=Ceratocystis fimbriata CBS 114723 TaxID=1035309 RepID=A0A2C5X1J7_9PEZI|nr:RNA polymerase II transcription factor B subunit 3 [Ceratocystis fimbriata CBS 114723]
MSRKSTNAALRMTSGNTSSLPSLSSENPAEDICPVCKTSRYLNRDLEFLINPECYHPMCANCVNRIFNEGPNQCPYAGCNKTLRHKGFRQPWFNDLTIERECDIRKRVAAIFNKGEGDFETLRDFNDYLERVEDLTADMVSGVEAARIKAEGELIEWENAHKAEIEANRRRRGEAEERARKNQQAEQERSRQLRLQAQQEDQAEKAAERKLREEQLNAIANGEMGKATEALNRIALKKRGKDAGVGAHGGAGSTASALSIRGLKDKKKRRGADFEDTSKPYDPFGGLDLNPLRFKMHEPKAYHNEWINAARAKDEFRVGGYNADDYIKRTMFEAFSGLAVFVEEEQPAEITTSEAEAVEAPATTASA